MSPLARLAAVAALLVCFPPDRVVAQEATYGGRTVAEWVAQLGAPDADARSAAAVALGRLGPDAAGAVSGLAALLWDDEEEVRANAAWALGQVGPAAVEAVGGLVGALFDDSHAVRGRAAVALGALGPSAPLAEEALRDGLRDGDLATRAAMAGALWCVTADSEEALPVLVELLGSDNLPARRSAAQALARVGSDADAAVPALLKALADDGAPVRAAAARALAALGTADEEVVLALAAAVGDADQEVSAAAEEALTALGAVGPDDTGPPDEVAPPDAPAADEGESWLPPGSDETELPEGYVEPPAEELTQYLGPLREHQARLEAVSAELEALAQQPSPTTADEQKAWTEQLRAVGRKGLTEGQAFARTLHSFLNAKTRHGLVEEVELIQGSMDLMVDILQRYQQMARIDPELFTPTLRDLLLAEAKTLLREELAERLEQRLELEGLKELLLSESWDEARQKVLTAARQTAEQEVEAATQRLFGLAFHDAKSARAAVRQRVHQEVQRQVTRLLVKVTSNQILIELAGSVIVDWLEHQLWPRLKEAFREKGELEPRTTRSIETLRAARRRLFAVPPDAQLSAARAELGRAEAALNAERYLLQDLERAGERGAKLLTTVEQEREDLTRGIHLTSYRFLLHTEERVEALKEHEDALKALLALLDVLIRGTAGPAEPAQPAGQYTAALTVTPESPDFQGTVTFTVGAGGAVKGSLEASFTIQVSDSYNEEGQERTVRYAGEFAGTLEGGVEGEGWNPGGGPNAPRNHLVVIVRVRDDGSAHGSIRGGAGVFGVMDFDTAE